MSTDAGLAKRVHHSSSSSSSSSSSPMMISSTIFSHADAYIQILSGENVPTIAHHLHELLRRDAAVGGERKFMPYLRTNDLLRLSECSKALLVYRHHLPRIMLCHPEQEKTIIEVVPGHMPQMYLDKLAVRTDGTQGGVGDEIVADPSVIQGVKNVLIKQLQDLDSLCINGPRVIPLVCGLAEVGGGCKVKHACPYQRNRKPAF